MARGAGLAAIKVNLNIRLGELHPRGATIHDTADGRPMRFAKGGDSKELS
jgi:hypothetical protein